MTHSRLGMACAVALLCVIGCSMPAAASAAEIIVRRDAGLSAHERAGIRADAGVELQQALVLPDTEVVTVPDGGEAQALAELRADPDVRFAVPDVTLHVDAAPDLQPLQWALRNPGAWALYPNAIEDSDIDATEAWQTIEGQTVTVGLVDQSVDGGHPDLLGNVEPGASFTEADGCTAGEPAGADDHGTQMAGLIAALRDGHGITGVAPLAHVLPLRAITNCGGGRLKWIINAFAAAGSAGLPIVSASFSSDPNVLDSSYNQAFLDIFDTYRDTLFVVAAGNEGNDVDDPAHPVYPCATKRPGATPNVDNLLCVGATDYRDEVACWSNVGQASVDLFAPGVSIISTARGGSGYVTRSGTSQATAMVAAAAAIVRSEDRSLGAAQLAQTLIDSVDGKNALIPISVSGGRLNVARALNGSGRFNSGGGESVTWRSCDRDHDGVRDDNGQDRCPDQPSAAADGCPDADGDGVIDGSDNCRVVANADQADTDADRVGNACDAMPRGDDPDGDGIPSLDDRCPAAPGSPPDGCPIVSTPPGGPPARPSPTPTTTPTAVAPAVIVSLRYKLSKCPKGKQCAKVATVTVKLSRRARVALKVERQDRNKRGRLVWTRVKLQSLTANARGSSLKVRGKRGKPSQKYRVTATLAGKTKAVSFKV